MRIIFSLLVGAYIQQVSTLLCFHCVDEQCSTPKKILCGSEDQRLLTDIYTNISFEKNEKSQYDCLRVLYTKFNPETFVDSDVQRVLGCVVRGNDDFCTKEEEIQPGIIVYVCKLCGVNYCNSGAEDLRGVALIVIGLSPIIIFSLNMINISK